MADFGISGMDTRAAVQDKNAGSTFQFNAAPQSMVMSPQPASFKENGVAVLSDTFGKISTALETWTKKQEQENFLVGQMMAQQGKSIEEVHENGGQMAVSGFKEMNTELAASKFKDQMMQAIATEDHQLSPVQYQQKLMENFRQVSSSLPTDDEYALKALTQQASSMFPELISAHTKANAQYIKNQTIQTASSLLVSKLNDPNTPDEQIKGFLDAGMNIKNKEDHKEALAAVGSSLAAGGTGTVKVWERLKSILGLPTFTPTGKLLTPLDASQFDASALTQAVLGQEGGTNPDGSFKTSPKGAIGPMQVMPDTGPDAAKAAGVPYDAQRLKTDSEYNMLLGTAYLQAQLDTFGSVDQALAAYNAGPTATRRAIAEAELVGHKDKWLEFLPRETQDYVPEVLTRLGYSPDNPLSMSRPLDFTSRAIELGFTPAQAEKLQNADDKSRTDSFTQFNTDKLEQEFNIYDSVKSGALSLTGGLQAIKKLGDTAGLTDKQMHSMAEKVFSASEAANKKLDVYAKAQAAISTDTVKDLPESVRSVAFDLKKAELQGEAMEQIRARGVQDQAQAAQFTDQYIRSGMYQFISRNAGVIDPRMQHQLEAAGTQPIKLQDGSMNPKVLAGYQDYFGLWKSAGPEAAKSYAGTAAPLFEEARLLDSASPTQEALFSAKQKIDILAQNRPAASSKDIKIDDAKLQAAIKTAIQQRDNWVFNGPNNNNVTGVFQRFNSENTALGTDSTLTTLALHEAQKAALDRADPNPERTGVETAFKRVDFAFGNLIVGPPDKSVVEAMGLSKEFSGTGIVERGLQHALELAGEQQLGSEWNKFQLFAPLDSTANKIRGVPAVGKIVYDYTPTATDPTGVFRVYPEIQQDTFWDVHKISAKPVVIPASLVKNLIIKDKSSKINLETVAPEIKAAFKKATSDPMFMMGQ